VSVKINDMKQTLLLTIFVLVSLTIYGQKTKKTTFKNDYPSYKETIYVLKEDNSIKHGDYQKNIRGKISISGQYENNLKIGVWEFYAPNGDLIHKYDYDADKLVFDKNSKDSETGNMRDAIPLGGYATFYQVINQLLRYPAEARRNGTQGKVYVKFTVGIDGKLSNIIAMEGIDDGCHKESVRVIEMINIDWAPALDTDGNPISSEITIPITYRLG
jgi:antitoxin component YwqK of YwqJK toxin-antitoxin module